MLKYCGIAVAVLACIALVLFYAQPYCSEMGMIGSSHCKCWGKETGIINTHEAATDSEPARTRCIGINLGTDKQKESH